MNSEVKSIMYEVRVSYGRGHKGVLTIFATTGTDNSSNNNKTKVLLFLDNVNIASLELSEDIKEDIINEEVAFINTENFNIYINNIILELYLLVENNPGIECGIKLKDSFYIESEMYHRITLYNESAYRYEDIFKNVLNNPYRSDATMNSIPRDNNIIIIALY